MLQSLRARWLLCSRFLASRFGNSRSFDFGSLNKRRRIYILMVRKDCCDCDDFNHMLHLIDTRLSLELALVTFAALVAGGILTSCQTEFDLAVGMTDSPQVAPGSATDQNG